MALSASELLIDLRDFAALVRERLEYVSSEMETRSSLINPFFEMLRWEVRNPKICRQEYPMDKYGRRTVDYALFDREGRVVILVEAKPLSASIEDTRVFAQLDGYISHSTAKFGIITNGRRYLWYSRDTVNNFLKKEASFLHDVTDPKPQDAEFLKAFLGDSFEADTAHRVATDVELESRLMSWFNDTANHPSEEFTRWMITQMRKKHPTMNLPKVLNQNNLPNLIGIVKSALYKYVYDRHIAFSNREKSSRDEIEIQPINTSEHRDDNRESAEEASVFEEQICQLESGEILKSSQRARAFRFRGMGWTKSKNRATVPFDLLSRFAECFDHGSSEFVEKLISASNVVSGDETEIHANQHTIAGNEIWTADMHNRSNQSTLVEDAALLFSPPLIEGQDYETWLPEGKPRKRR